MSCPPREPAEPLKRDGEENLQSHRDTQWNQTPTPTWNTICPWTLLTSPNISGEDWALCMGHLWQGLRLDQPLGSQQLLLGEVSQQHLVEVGRKRARWGDLPRLGSVQKVDPFGAGILA
ncbi:hypothetical protein EYF80_021971 [Liparis tanakae]|uniref:Uncharacterized protein n=1 Tax=Liparis tanakae TaxID=230148 RepID=A0A4Z2HPW4_9TELE|nr:hypothetical protein EYF80_021971 [Liparis tanakae]